MDSKVGCTDVCVRWREWWGRVYWNDRAVTEMSGLSQPALCTCALAICNCQGPRVGVHVGLRGVRVGAG